ncbi:MAG: hypothetical protein AAGA80_25180 [Cyanobacteria bacterium P01_F01_bin.143]
MMGNEQGEININSGNYNEKIGHDYVEGNHYEIKDNAIIVVNKSNNQISNWKTLGLVTVLAGISVFFLASRFFISEEYVTYKNSEYKVEHPKKWRILEEDGFPYPGIRVISPQENAEDNFQEQVKFSIEELHTPLSLIEYTEDAVIEIKSFNLIIETPKKSTLANREGRKVIYKSKDGKKSVQVWALKNKKVYIVTYTAEANKFKKFEKQAEKIIQSLSITN